MNQKKSLQNIQALQHSGVNGIIQAMEQGLKSNEKDNEDFFHCEQFRKEALESNELISYEVFGSSKRRPLFEVAGISPSTPVWCRLIHNIVKQSNANRVLEIGTNIGISGSYILSAMPDTGHFLTMEGNPQYCEISRAFFSRLPSKTTYRIVEGLFDSTFPRIMDSEGNWDVVFIDGNHYAEPTWEYFTKLSERMASGGIMLFDDIHWSSEMKQVWRRIISHSKVLYSIDLFHVGIVFLKEDNGVHPNESSQHFSLHYAY